MSREWDAATYDRVADPQARWGAEVIGRVDPAGVARVLDAGCGTGRVTERLLERLPDAACVALDASAQMLAEAGRRLARFGGRVTFVCADLRDPLPLDRPVDAIVSTATFHWVPDHAGLFRRLAQALRPRGQLVAQYGGVGNIASVVGALAEIGDPLPGRWTYPTPEEERRRLAAAGFVDVQVWLQPEPTAVEPGGPFETFLATVILREHVALLPEPERAGLVRAVAARLPGACLDYVRLNVVARRG
jgi:trans-aconitate 2-methyltransferase